MTEEKTGAEILALAHNGNLSNGRMFPIIESFNGRRIDREYAENRMRWEPLYEATQIKGDGETHPFLSPNDEFANFERWDKGNLDLTEVKKPEMLEFEYARSALKNGLKMEAELGVNPYKFGLVGSTDSHTGLAAVEEDNFFGKTSSSEPSADRATHPFVKTGKAVIMGWEQTASGYAAVWATENTREAIFDAMKRRETYATTGPRMVVRFFGGWDFEPSDANNRLPARIGYSKGVPMGGDLSSAPSGKAPSFLVAALKDTYGIAAYIILPRAVRMGLKVLQRKHVPRYTITGDGLPGDPVNLVLMGTLQQLRAAFATADWTEADPLGFASSWRMVQAFIFNSRYPAAPFSTLYLFGRGQDIGFQKAIDNSPRKRHHIRFWALSLASAEETLGTSSFWINNDRPPENARVYWVGAGTRDTGFSLTRLTFQITHATDSDTNAERDYIIAELSKNRVIRDAESYQSGQHLSTERVNHYVTDGEVTLASLV